MTEPCTRLMPDGTTCLRPAVVVYDTRWKRYPLCARHESAAARRFAETHPGWERQEVPQTLPDGPSAPVAS